MEKEINNEVYNQIDWYAENEALYLLRGLVNPVRVPYFRQVIRQQLKLNTSGLRALEVGCGGGVLTMEIARMGFDTYGIDISENAIKQAGFQSQKAGLEIQYQVASALDLPFEDASFDVVFCCDVLEHLPSVSNAIAEIARVTKTGGVFFYDTINRTRFSKLSVIKVAQEWKPVAFMPENLHVWDMFITPGELVNILSENRISQQEMRGMVSSVNPLIMLLLLRKRAKGKITYKELCERAPLIESTTDFRSSYMGYALKEPVGSTNN